MGKIEKFICLLGLPRSGTTVATTILDAHSAVEMFYEPWNSSRSNPPPIYENPEQFQTKMRETYSLQPKPEATVIGFKETSTHYDALEWSGEILAVMGRHCRCQLIVIVRNLMHTYLSKVEGARKYWNHPDIEVSEKGYQNFLLHSMEDYKFFYELSKQVETIFFHYNALVTQPEYVVAKIMDFIGLSYENGQLNYHLRSLQKKKILGDPSFLVKSQKGIGISKDSISSREKQSEEFKKILTSHFWRQPEIMALETWIQHIEAHRVMAGPVAFSHLV